MMCAATSRADRDVVIVFDHIPKCAGTSVDTILQQASCCSYGVHSASSQIQVARRLNATRHPGVTLLMGHYGFGIHALLSKAYDVRYFTFLRDPFAVARSLYTYNKATQMYLYGSFADFLVEYPFRHMVDFFSLSTRPFRPATKPGTGRSVASAAASKGPAFPGRTPPGNEGPRKR